MSHREVAGRLRHPFSVGPDLPLYPSTSPGSCCSLQLLSVLLRSCFHAFHRSRLLLPATATPQRDVATGVPSREGRAAGDHKSIDYGRHVRAQRNSRCITENHSVTSAETHIQVHYCPRSVESKLVSILSSSAMPHTMPTIVCKAALFALDRLDGSGTYRGVILWMVRGTYRGCYYGKGGKVCGACARITVCTHRS